MPPLNVAFWRLGGLGPKAGSERTWVPSVSPGVPEMPGLMSAADRGSRRGPRGVDMKAGEHRAVQLEVEKALDALGESRPEAVTVQTLSGTPAHELLSAARDADMIVVGSRGTGGFARLLMGSVSTQVSHHAHCPVVIIPPEDRG